MNRGKIDQWLRKVGPAQQRQPAIHVLDERRAAFHPIAVIAVQHTFDVAHGCMVYVPADDAVATSAGRRTGSGLLEAGDVLPRVGYFPLDPGCQRPVSESEVAAQAVESVIHAEHGPVDSGPQPAIEAAEPDGIVELVTVEYQHATPVSGTVDQTAVYLDPAEVKTAEITHEVVVVAGHVDDAGSVSRAFQQRLQDILMPLGPVEGAPQRSEVDQIADHEDIAGVERAEEIEQLIRPASPVAQMDVRDEDATHLHARARLVVADDGLMTVF